MKLGIIGLGTVGAAVRHGFQKLGHQVLGHDVKDDTRIDQILDAEIVFICVPTPSCSDGSSDPSIVEAVVEELYVRCNYRGVIAVKSTVEPGTTEKLIKKYPDGRICFVPEFLRERCAVTDFVENHDVCIVGTHSDEIYNLIRRAHGHLPEQFVRLSPTEAELAKYFSNTYNAMMITFANAFYQICQEMECDYQAMKDAIAHRKTINNHYLDCNENLRGFGGMCLPKDTKAIAALAVKLGLNIDLLQAIISDNQKYEVNVLEGSRS